MGSFLSFLPAIIGGIGGLFKGNKQKYAAQQTPQQQAAYNALLQMLQRRSGTGSAGYQPTSDALNMISRMFGVGGGNYGMPQNTATLPPHMRNPYINQSKEIRG